MARSQRVAGIVVAAVLGAVIVALAYEKTKPTTLEDVGEEAQETADKAGSYVEDQTR